MGHQFDFVFLLKAIKDKNNIDLLFKRHKKTFRLGSRFLELCPDQNSIVIECPTIRGIYHQVLKEKQPISIIFHSTGFRLKFDSQVLKKKEYNQKSMESIPALEIAWPEMILDQNRRNFYRMAVSTGESIRITFKSSVPNGQNEPVKSQKKEFEKIEAVMIDISKNGMSFKTKSKTKITIGDRIRIDFFLGDQSKEFIEFEGNIRNIRQVKGTETHFCGVEFDHRESDKNQDQFKKIASFCLSLDREKVDFHFVDKIVSRNFLVQKIVDGEVDREVLEMLLKKKFTLTEEEYLEALVYVLRFQRYKNRAHFIIKSISDEVKEEYVKKQEANHRVVYFVLLEALKRQNSRLLLAIIQNQYIPIKFLLKIAREGPNHLLTIMLDMKEKLIAYPEIMEVMTKNLRITPRQKKKIQEIKEEYIKEFEVQKIPRDKVIHDVHELVKGEAVLGDKSKKKISSSDIKKQILNTLDRINKMTLSQKIKLAFEGDTYQRIILARSIEEIIILALLENPHIEDSDVIRILENQNITERAILKIVKNSQWMKNQKTCLHLIKNPRCPLNQKRDILNRFSVQALKKLIELKKLPNESNTLILEILKKKNQ